MIKNLPAMQKTWVLCGEDLPEKGTATHSSLPAWKIPWTEGPGRLQSMGLQESDTIERLNHPLQYSGLENSMDRGAWQATVHGVESQRVGHD